MSPLALLVFVAALAVLALLAAGVASMAQDGEVAHHTSAQWMVWRVVFQVVVAFLMILFALLVSS
jgi:hypothetical protein